MIETNVYCPMCLDEMKHLLLTNGWGGLTCPWCKHAVAPDEAAWLAVLANGPITWFITPSDRLVPYAFKFNAIVSP